jgi:hypothetical protein
VTAAGTGQFVLGQFVDDFDAREIGRQRFALTTPLGRRNNSLFSGFGWTPRSTLPVSRQSPRGDDFERYPVGKNAGMSKTMDPVSEILSMYEFPRVQIMIRTSLSQDLAHIRADDLIA